MRRIGLLHWCVLFLAAAAVAAISLTKPAEGTHHKADRAQRSAGDSRPAGRPQMNRNQPGPVQNKTSVTPAVESVTSEKNLTREQPVAVALDPKIRTEEEIPDSRSAAEDDGSAIRNGEGSLEGLIRQPDGVPVAGLEVHLRPMQRKNNGATTYTDEQGRYRFPVMSSGRYRLDLGPVDQPIAFAPDLLRLNPTGNYYDLRTPRLGGMIVGVKLEDGVQPAIDATIRIEERLGRMWEGITGADGSIQFSNLPTGQYRVLLFRKKVRVAYTKQYVLAHGRPEVLLTMPPEPAPEEAEGEETDTPAEKGKGKGKKKKDPPAPPHQ